MPLKRVVDSVSVVLWPKLSPWCLSILYYTRIVYSYVICLIFGMLTAVNVYLYALRMHATEIRVKWQIWIKASSLTTTTTRYRWYVLCVLCTIHVNKSASHHQLAYVRFCVCAHVHIRIIFWCRIFRLSRLSLVRGFSVIYYTWFSMKLILMHVIPVPSTLLHWQSFGKTKQKKTKTNSPIPMDMCVCVPFAPM